MVLDSQRVATVPVLFPVTCTAMYLPFWAEVSFKVVREAPFMARQLFGTFWVGLATLAVHAYHLYVNVGVGAPVHRPLLAVKVCPTRA